MAINTLTVPARTVYDVSEWGIVLKPVSRTSGIEAMVEHVAGKIAECLNGRYVALLIVGAAARGECTLSADGELLSDLDFLVVLPQRNAAMAALEERACRAQLRKLDTLLTSDVLSKVSVGFANSVPRYWSVATPLMWELRTNGRVLDGSERIKEYPAIRSASQIPQWEGIRLVANRMCELLGAYGAACGEGAGYPGGDAIQKLRYACVKMALACSEAALIEAGQYAGSYSARYLRQRQVTARFTAAQNELIVAAYHAKISGVTYRPARAAFDLVSDVLDLAVSTLNRFGLLTPADLAERARTEEPAAPGALTDIAHFVAQQAAGKRGTIRRAIAPIYEDAYHLSLSLVGLPTSWDQGLAGACQQLIKRYKSAPQVVGVIRAGGGA